MGRPCRGPTGFLCSKKYSSSFLASAMAASKKISCRQNSCACQYGHSLQTSRGNIQYQLMSQCCSMAESTSDVLRSPCPGGCPLDNLVCIAFSDPELFLRQVLSDIVCNIDLLFHGWQVINTPFGGYECGDGFTLLSRGFLPGCRHDVGL